MESLCVCVCVCVCVCGKKEGETHMETLLFQKYAS